MNVALTGYIDLAQIVLYLFWAFFAGLIYYLHRENKREGYPLESDRTARAPHVPVVGWPPLPEPKTYKLAHGGTFTSPTGPDKREVKAVPAAGHPGAPLVPTGNPMVDGVGPAAWAQRQDAPDLTYEGEPKIVPMRVATDFSIADGDPDPRGMALFGADGQRAGTIADAWVDRSEVLLRYFEAELPGGGRVLVPLNFAKVLRGKKEVHVNALLARHFADVPRTRHPDQVTLLEEDKIVGYFGGGTLYAEPSRQEPLL